MLGPQLLARRGRLALAAAALALATGCAAPQGPSAAGAEALLGFSPPPCVGSVELVEHWDEPTPLGFSAVEALSWLSGASSAPLVWLEPPASGEYLLTYAPEHGLSSLRLQVSAADGSITYRHQVPSWAAPEGTECPPATLSVPVQVSLHSAGGALSETFVADLQLEQAQRGRLSKVMTADGLAGGLTVLKPTSLDPARSFSVEALSLTVELWPGGSRGTLSPRIAAALVEESAHAWPAPPSQPGPLVIWPSAVSCGDARVHLPSDARVMGFSMRDVVSALATHTSEGLRWSDGSQTDLALELEPPPAYACQGIDEALEFTLGVRVRSADGRVDTVLPVQVRAEGFRGQLVAVSLESLGEATPAQLGPSDTGAQPAEPVHLVADLELDASYAPAAGAWRGSGTLSWAAPGAGTALTGQFGLAAP